MAGKILIGYDGTEFSNQAIADLSHAGLGVDGEAVVVTAADLWPAITDGVDPRTQPEPTEPMARTAYTLLSAAMAEAESTAKQGAERVRAALPTWKVTAEVSTQSPTKALIALAEKSPPDLIVVGPRGRSAVAQFFAKVIRGAGSVAQQVIRYAPCSVRIGRHSGEQTSWPRPLNILIGVDGSSESAAAVQCVVMRSWPAGTKVRVVAALDQFAMSMMVVPNLMTPEMSNDTLLVDGRLWARQAVDRCAVELKEAGLTVEPVVGEGDPKHVLLREAEHWPADCVFVGAHGMSRFERVLLGSVSAAVAERAHCSVEIVRHPGSR